LPAPNDRLCLAGSPHDLGRAAPVGRGKDDFSAPDMLLRHLAIADNRLKPTAVGFGRFGNRLNESDH
jgi:hypothetical protein